MARSSGVYTPPASSWYPTTSGASATKADWDALLADIASALTQSISSDGQTTITGNLPMAGFKLTGLGAGSTTGDSLRWEQLFSQGTVATLASAATVTIGGQNSTFIEISGTTGISSFGATYSGPRWIRFQGALTLTHNATTLNLPGAADITTAAGDTCVAIPNAAANGWNVYAYQRASTTVSNSLATMTTSRLLGRTTAGTGGIEQLTAGASLSLSAGSLNVNTASSSDMQTGTDANKVPPVSAIRGGLLVNGTSTTTNSTAHAFSSIPSWVKKITIQLIGVTTGGTSSPLIQIGTGGAASTSGYLGTAGVIQNAGSSATSNYTTGFGLLSSASGNVIHGTMTLTLQNAATNTWVSSHSVGWSNSAICGMGGGSKSLAGTLDYVRLTTVGGADSFSAGTINILYE